MIMMQGEVLRGREEQSRIEAHFVHKLVGHIVLSS